VPVRQRRVEQRVALVHRRGLQPARGAVQRRPDPLVSG
jgi:hypothetical protein